MCMLRVNAPADVKRRRLSATSRRVCCQQEVRPQRCAQSARLVAPVLFFLARQEGLGTTGTRSRRVFRKLLAWLFIFVGPKKDARTRPWWCHTCSARAPCATFAGTLSGRCDGRRERNWWRARWWARGATRTRTFAHVCTNLHSHFSRARIHCTLTSSLFKRTQRLPHYRGSARQLLHPPHAVTHPRVHTVPSANAARSLLSLAGAKVLVYTATISAAAGHSLCSASAPCWYQGLTLSNARNATWGSQPPRAYKQWQVERH